MLKVQYIQISQLEFSSNFWFLQHDGSREDGFVKVPRVAESRLEDIDGTVTQRIGQTIQLGLTQDLSDEIAELVIVVEDFDRIGIGHQIGCQRTCL